MLSFGSAPVGAFLPVTPAFFDPLIAEPFSHSVFKEIVALKIVSFEFYDPSKPLLNHQPTADLNFIWLHFFPVWRKVFVHTRAQDVGMCYFHWVKPERSGADMASV